MPTSIATNFINFTRDSLATVTDSDGKIKRAGHNFLPFSEQLDNSSVWLQNNVTIAPNAIVAPNGTQTAETFTSTGSLATVRQAYNSINATLTAGIYAKAGTTSTVMIRATQSGNGQQVIFNLSTVTAAAATVQGTGGTVSNMIGSISSVGSGWYYCRVTFNETDYGNIYFGTDATSGTFHLWGAHFYRSDLGGMQGNQSAYPMYYPTTPRNLLGYTENFTNTYWYKRPTAMTIESNVAIAPNGLPVADRINFSTQYDYVEPAVLPITVVGTKVTVSVWLKLVSGNANLVLRGTSVATAYTQNITVTTEWQRFSATFTHDGTNNIGLTIQDRNSSGFGSVLVWGAQMSDSGSLDPYVANHFAAPTSAAYYAPRIDYDPVTLACKGLLVEQQRENLLLGSDQLNNTSYWFAANAIVTENNTSSPDGTINADRIVFTTTGGLVIQDYATTTSTTYTASIYLRADSATTIRFRLQQSGGGSTLLTCSLTTSWQRFIATYTAVAPTFMRFVLQPDSNTPTVYAYGAQLEVGSFATSYIPTIAISETRNADVASVSAQAFPYNEAEGTLLAYADWTNAAVATLIYQRIALLGSPGDPYARSIQRQDTSATGVALFYRGMSTGVNIATSGNSAKIGLAWSSTGGSGSVNGSAASSFTGTPTSSDGLPINILRIGNASDGTFFNGHIRSISYVPKRLTNLELQKRST